MEHSFNIEVAKVVGVNAAIIYNNIKFWCEKNRANEKHFYDGNYWTYNSKKALLELFPYMTYSQIKSSLNVLFEKGYIGKNCYNSNPYDRTNWYCDLYINIGLINDKSNGHISPMECTPVSSQLATHSQCITDINTDINTDTTTSVEEKKLQNSFGVYDSIDDAIAEMKNHTDWKTSMCKQTGVSNLEDCDRWIDKFRDHAIASGITKFNLKDLKYHCFSWLRKRIGAGDKLPVVVDKTKKHIPNISHLQFH